MGGKGGEERERRRRRISLLIWLQRSSVGRREEK